MNVIIACILFFSFALPSAAELRAGDLDLQIKMQGSNQTNQTPDIAAQVKKALAAVRKGNRAELEALKGLGEAVIPFLEPYLTDANVDVRIEVVDLALKIGGTKALNLIAAALRNSKPQIQKSTAQSLYIFNSQYRKYSISRDSLPSGEFALYENYSPEKIASVPQIGDGLRNIVKSGNANVAAVFLLTNFPGDETAEVLRNGKESFSKEIKLAAEIVQANAGDQNAVQYLSQAATKNDVGTIKFLLTNIAEVQSPEVLSLLAGTLDNKTYIAGTLTSKQLIEKYNLPKGSSATPLQPRRVCDLAVNSLVEKFNLKISFKLHSTTYIVEQISEVINLVGANLKR